MTLPILTKAQQRHYDAWDKFVTAQHEEAMAENEGLHISNPEEFQRISNICDAASKELTLAEAANGMSTNKLVEYAITPVPACLMMRDKDRPPRFFLNKK